MVPIPYGFSGTAVGGSWAQLQGASFERVVHATELLKSQGATAGVIAMYCDWIALQPADSPLLHAAWFNLGVELSRAGLTADAVVAYRRAISLRPDFHLAAVNLGLALEQCGDPEAALRCWAAALQPDEAQIALINQQARVLEAGGKLADAESALRRSLLLQPDQPDAVQHWLHLRQRMCVWPAIDESIPGLDASAIIERCGPLSALALTDDPEVQTAIGSSWLARKTQAADRLSPAKGYPGHDRIRLGYVSSDFCNHALSFLMAEVFERHDRGRFELFGYCSSPEDGSEQRARVMAAFDRFRSVRTLDHAALARLIRDDEIDILVDLNGLTAGSRLQALRWRPAPVQATYLGFVGPVPLPELDYLFCDSFVVPEERVQCYSPTPLAIASLYQANDSRPIRPPELTRAQAGLPERGFVFACFSNHYKIAESVFSSWMEILAQVPGSVIWLAADNEWSAVNLRGRASRAGIDPERIIISPRTGILEYRARLSVADLFLDTFPYNAGTVASDAIRAGLPVMTLAGRSFASRMAARLLTELGADRGIASTPSDYVATAVALASREAEYLEYRRRFSPERWAATIGNTASFMEAYEATLQGIAKPKG